MIPIEQYQQPTAPPMPQFFGPVQSNAAALEYRLGGKDVITDVIDQLKGGYDIVDGEKAYREDQRLMNDLGIGKVEMFLTGFVNKVVHLTKYKNEERVMLQIREAALAFLFELTMNMKRWGPKFTVKLKPEQSVADFVRRSGAIAWKLDPNDPNKLTYRVKVRNRRLVLTMVENAILASAQRGEGGTEAENTIKQINVSESRSLDNQQQQRPGLFSGLNNILGR